jgi:SAM-dependent methyltransferase
MSGYTLDNNWYRERERLSALEAVLDPKTVRHLESLGVGEGWRCLEVGAGGGSIAEWLCRRVGATGHVVATDTNTRFLSAIAAPNLEIRRHDVAADPLPEAAFDLVHARAVLEHLPERQAILGRLAAALRPGGWLVVEDADYETWTSEPAADRETAALFQRGSDACLGFRRRAGLDTAFAGRLHGALRTLGLADVGAEGTVSPITGGSAYARIWRLSFEQVGARVVAAGLLDEADLIAFLALLDDPGFTWRGPIVTSVWGRRLECRPGS